MAFNAGSLVATFRLGLSGFEADKAKALASFKQAGAAADAAGASAAAVGTKAAAGARQTAAAAGQEAAAHKAAGAAAAAAGTKKVAAEKDAETAAERLSDRIHSQRRDFEDVGRGVIAFGAAAAAGFGVAIAAQVQFGAKQAQLRTLSAGDAHSQAQLNAQMAQAAEAALTAGAAYGQTAGDVQDAEIELQKAGVGITQQMGGALKGALTLAAAGQEDVADATSTAVTAMTQFNLTAGDVPHLADLLAAGADKALGSVGDLSMGLKQGGLVASQMGLSVDDTVGTLSAFAQAGLIGSDAGTSFKTMLLSLQSPSSQAKKYLDEYNISAYDQQGAFVGIANLAGQLQQKLGGLTQQQRDAALSTIFGTDAIRSANVLYTQGASGIQGWIDKVNDSGFAAQQAAGKMDSLEGDSQKLASAWTNSLIRAGTDLDPVLRGVVQGATGVVTAFGQLDPVTGAIALGLVGLVGAAALGGGGLLLLLPKIAEFRVAAETLATADLPLLSAGIRGLGAVGAAGKRGLAVLSDFIAGPWGLALAAGALALAGIKAYADSFEPTAEEMDNSARTAASGLQILQTAAGKKMPISSPFDALQDVDKKGGIVDLKKGLQEVITEGASFSGWFRRFDAEKGATGLLGATLNTIRPLSDSLGRLASTDLPSAQRAFHSLGTEYGLNGKEQWALLQNMPAYKQALVDQATAQNINVTSGSAAEQQTKLLAFANGNLKSEADQATDAAKAQAAAVGQIQGSAAAASQDVSQLAQDIKGLGSATLDARSANREMQQAVDDATTAFKKNGNALGDKSQKGRDDEAAMDRIASAATAAAAATYTQTGSIDKATASMAASRKEFIDSVAPILGSRAAAKKLADQLGLIPANVDSLVAVTGIDAAELALKQYLAKINGIPGDIRTQVSIDAINSPKFNGTGPLKNKAGGGSVIGGIAGVDSVPILAKSGEYVLDTADVGRMGGSKGVDAFRADLAGASGFAAGGAIGDAQGKASAANTASDRLERQIADEVKRVSALRKKATAAANAYSKATDATSAIYGKGTGAQKHTAEQHARDLSKASKAAAAAQAAAEKKLAADRDAKSKSDQKAQDQAARQTTLTQTSQDLGTSLGRGELIDSSNPFGAVDQAVAASRDANYTKAQRKTLAAVAATQEKALEGLTQKATDAKNAVDADTASLQTATDATANAQQALDSLKSTADSLASSVANTVKSFFSLGSSLTQTDSVVTSIAHNAGTAAEWDEKQTTVTPGGTSARAILNSAAGAATQQGQFAAKLQGLVDKGYSTAVVQDVAGLGVSDGSQVADALLAGTTDEVSGINFNYQQSANYAGLAGGVVSQQAYGADLSAAQAVLDSKTAAQAAAQSALDNDNRNVASINQSIEGAQQAVVTALQNALGKAKANGGIVDAYASGGMRQAQIQPGGRNILWAEGETGGEAYIPFAASKRARSLAILAETARRLGVAVVPGGQAYADGGISGGGSTSYGGDTYYLQGMWLGSPQQVAGQLKRDAAKEKARKNRAAQIGRVNP